MSATMLTPIQKYPHNTFLCRPCIQLTKPNNDSCSLIHTTISQRPLLNVRVVPVPVPVETDRMQKQDSNAYASLLEMSASLKSLASGKQIHASILKTGHEEDMLLQTKLILMYAKCENIVYARLVFDRMQNPDIYSFTPIIVEYFRQGHIRESLALYYEMHKACVRQDDLIFSTALDSCAGMKALQLGKQIHAHVMKCGFESDLFVGNSLVDMYAKCGSVEDVRQVFERIPHRNRISWNSMISVYAQNKRGDEALKIFRHMQLVGEKPKTSSWTAIISGYAQNGCWDEVLKVFCEMQLANMEPNAHTLASILQAYGRLEAIEQGRQIHGFIIKGAFQSSVFVGNALMGMYSKCRSIDDARQVFDKLSQRNVVSWNVMVAGYAQNGLLNDGLNLFDQMQTAGVKPNLITMNTLIAGCAANGQCDMALEFFSDMQLKGLMPSVISWTAVITGYAQNGHGKDALKLFYEMVYAGVNPNSNTIAGVLSACSGLAALQQGKGIHGYIIKRGFESDVFVGSALVNMYGKCGDINSALLVFDKMPEKNVVTWNSIIAVHAQRNVDDALKLFVQMQSEKMKPDAFTWNVMITGYAQNGQVEKASKLFSQMQVEGMKPSVISWTAVIAGYTHKCQSEDALKLFNQMLMTGAKPNSVTIATVLPACASLATLEQGKQIHGYSIRNEFESDVVVGTALIDMYAKCGSIKNASSVFNKLPERNLFTWNSMITGHALNGNGKDAILLFHQMIQEGINPDSITFTGILSACSHSGLLDEGWQYFNSMAQDYGITPNMTHHACMVDLLGRGGFLDKAQDFIENMPLQPNASVWGTLLSACRTHLNVDLGEYAAKHLFQIEPHNAANYVLLLNIYALAGRWDDIRTLKEVMKDIGVERRLGWSWIRVENKVHTFFVGDRSHPQMAEIHASLQNLFGQMKEAGYAPDTNCVIQNVDKKEKEDILRSHSEKLAIAFGLINTHPGTPLRIIRNLRVCGDCHTAAKFISKITLQDIFIRDRHRFHHFKDGLCSCGDYW